MTVGAMRGCELRAPRSCGWSRELNMTNCLTVFTVAYVDFILVNTKVVFVVVMFLQNGHECYLSLLVAGWARGCRHGSPRVQSLLFMTHSLACAICCSVLLVFSFSSLLNLGSKTRSCTQQSAGVRNRLCHLNVAFLASRVNLCLLHYWTARTCRWSTARLAVLFRCLLLAMLFFACCWPCSSLPAVGHALLCLLLAMLFLRRLFGSACACHPRLLPVVTQRLCCSSPSSVSLGGPPDCNANSLFQLFHWLFSSPCACHPRLFSAYPNSLDNLTLPLPVFFSITGSSGCDSFSVLSSSDVASCERRVPRAPLCGSLRQCDRQSGTSNATTRSAPLRDRWFAVGTLASLCGSLQQRGPLSLRKFSLSGLGTTLPRCGLGPPTWVGSR